MRPWPVLRSWALLAASLLAAAGLGCRPVDPEPGPNQELPVKLEVFVEPKELVPGMAAFFVYKVTNVSDRSLLFPGWWKRPEYVLTLTDSAGRSQETCFWEEDLIYDPKYKLKPGESFEECHFLDHWEQAALAEGPVTLELRISCTGSYTAPVWDKDHKIASFREGAPCWKGDARATASFRRAAPSAAERAAIEHLWGKAVRPEDVRTKIHELAAKPEGRKALQALESTRFAADVASSILSQESDWQKSDYPVRPAPEAVEVIRAQLAKLERCDLRVYRERAAVQSCLLQYALGDRRGAIAGLERMVRQGGMLKGLHLAAEAWLAQLRKGKP